MGNARYRNGFQLTLHEDLIDAPLRWRKPRLVFVNSMSDLFHEGIPLEFIKRVFKTMVEADHHIFQILTKRSVRLLELSHALPWPKNVWMGVSVENQMVTDRITHLQQVPAHIRFLSLEPLLGPLDALKLDGIHWVIVGGESGPKARPVQKKWVESIREQCKEQRIAFFFKQWGGTRKKETGRILNGKTYDQVPELAFDHISASDIFADRFASA